MFAVKMCSCNDAVNHAKVSLPNRDEIDRAAEIFKLCSDSTRVGILCALCSHSLCVCEIASVLGMSSSAISHQLRLLKVGRLVKSRKQGRVVYYSLDDSHIGQIFAMAFAHVMEEMGENCDA